MGEGVWNSLVSSCLIPLLSWRVQGSLTPPAPQWGSSNEPEALDPAAEWLREAPAAGLVAQACLAGVGAEILALQSLYVGID